MPRIEDYYLPTDGNDWLSAITRAQQEFHTPGDPTGTPGFTLEFGPSEYFFSDTIRLVRSLRLVGAAGKRYSTVFNFGLNKGGILCAWQLSGTDQFRSDTSIIERITLRPLSGGGTSAMAHGITMQVKVALRDLYIEEFPGDGIHIEATHPAGNAINWHISNVQINGCGGDGLSVAGTDAGFGYANLLVCGDNAGWGIRDHSDELGNTYISCVAEENGGGFNTRHANAPRSVFINCDVEGKGQSIIDAPAMVINSRISNMIGNAVVFNASGAGAGFSSAVNAVSPVVLQPLPAAPGTGRQVLAALGSSDTSPPGPAPAPADQILGALSLSVLTIDSEGKVIERPIPNVGSLELLYGYKVPGWWGFFWDKSPGSPLRISTREAVPNVGEAQIWCEMGIFFGSTMVHVTASGSTDTAPPSRPGRNAGDIEFNSDPQAGGHVGWVWVVPAGSTGSWKQFGKIEP
jgi:hypothetical protein